MKSVKFLILFTILYQINLSAQPNYKNAVGLNISRGYGLSIKHFIKQQTAFEINTSYDFRKSNLCNNALQIALKCIMHTNIRKVKGLNWYYGVELVFLHIKDETSSNYGLNFGLGLDYKLGKTPINISIDFFPSFISYGYNNNLNLNLRYAF